MPALNDGRCAKCNTRMGWPGELRDKPACPKCGHKPDAAELAEMEETEKQMAAMEEKILNRKQKS